MSGNNEKAQHLHFEEKEDAHLLTATRRVVALLPQIAWYKERVGHNWKVIHSSILAKGIVIAEQSVRNIASRYRDSTQPMAPGIRSKAGFSGFEVAQHRSIEI